MLMSPNLFPVSSKRLVRVDQAMERASEAADTEPKRRFRGKSGDLGGGGSGGGGRANGEYINLGHGGRNMREEEEEGTTHSFRR